MVGIYILLGSNLGDRLRYLQEVHSILPDYGITIEKASSIYETEPWGMRTSNWFLNVVLKINTSSSPLELLQTIQCIEQVIGRVRDVKYTSRCIDIDILYFFEKVINLETLKIPHPSIQERKFTLIPMVEIASFVIHPYLKVDQTQLLADCTDTLACHLTTYRL